jgi:Spy/CpxP family protein refolding chaperone
MRNTIKFCLVLVALFFAADIFAQKDGDNSKARHKGGNHGEKMETHLKQMSTRLSLTASQESQIREILKNSRQEMKDYREKNKTAGKDEKREAMRSLRKRTDASINDVLDAKQKELYAQYKKEKRAQHGKKVSPVKEEMGEDRIF